MSGGGRMTLDDAIVAFGQIASDGFDYLELDVRDYERLVKWLTELKLARESAFSDIGLAARAVSENNQLKAENAKLRREVGVMQKAYAIECDNGCNLEAENATLRQQLADVTESMGRVEERCAKLRELCADLYAEMLTYSTAPNYNASVWAVKLRELGIEV